MVREEKLDFKHVLEEAEDEMVNVNTQVSSSMEAPFGEYTLFVFIISSRWFQWKKRLSVAAAFSFSLCGLCSGCLPPELGWITTDSGWKHHRHLCMPFSHGCNPGGVSEIWRLLKKAMGAGPDGDDGAEVF